MFLRPTSVLVLAAAAVRAGARSILARLGLVYGQGASGGVVVGVVIAEPVGLVG